VFILLLSFFAAFANEKYSGDIYDLEGKEKLMTYEADRTLTKDTMEFKAVFKDLNGNITGQESGTVVAGKLVKYTAERPPAKDSGLVEVKDGKIHFTYTDGGKTSDSKATFKEDTLFSGMLVPHMQSNFDTLLAKKDLKFPYVVWYRKEAMGFRVQFDREDGGNVVFKMAPSNMLYRSLVNPIEFTFEKATKKLISIKGRTMPKVSKDGKLRDFDALIKYK